MAGPSKVAGPRDLLINAPGLVDNLRNFSAIRNPRAFRQQVETHFGSLSDARQLLTLLVFRSAMPEEVALGRDIVGRLIPDALTGLLAANSRVRDRVFSEIADQRITLAGEELTAAQDVLEAMTKQAAFRVPAREALDILFPQPAAAPAPAAQPEAAKATVADAAALPLTLLGEELVRVTDKFSEALLSWEALKRTVGQFRSELDVDKQQMEEIQELVPGLESTDVIRDQTTELENRLGSLSLRAFELVDAGWAVKRSIDKPNTAGAFTFKPSLSSQSLLPASLLSAFADMEGRLVTARDLMAKIVVSWEANRQPVDDYIGKLEKASDRIRSLNVAAGDQARLSARQHDLDRIEALRSQVLGAFGESQKKASDVIKASDQLAAEMNSLLREAEEIPVVVQVPASAPPSVPPSAPAAPAAPVPPPPPSPIIKWDRFAQAISNGAPVTTTDQAKESSALRRYLQNAIDHMRKNYPAEYAPVIAAIEKHLVRLSNGNLGLIKYALRRDVLEEFLKLGDQGLLEARSIYDLLEAKVIGKRVSIPPPPPAPAVDEDAKTAQISGKALGLPSFSAAPPAPSPIGMPFMAPPPVSFPAAPPRPIPTLVINSPREMAESVAKFTGGDPTSLFQAIKTYFKTFRPEVQPALENTLSEIDLKVFATPETLCEEIDRRVRKFIYQNRMIGYREFDQVELEYIGA